MSTATPFVFTWAPPRRRIRALFFFLIASFLLHALCFYVFQIAYPPTVALMPAPARLNLISGNNAETVAFLRWIEAEDPAANMETQRSPDARSLLPTLQHKPSYADHEPALKPLPERAPDLRVPSAAATGPVRLPRIEESAAAAPITRATAVLLGEDSARPESAPAGFHFESSAPEAPANVRFRVALDRGGTIRYCFLAEGSGDPTLDEQARRFLQLCRFQSRRSTTERDGLSWTTATVLWGNDVILRHAGSP